MHKSANSLYHKSYPRAENRIFYYLCITMEKIRCTVEGVTFYNQENGWVVARVKSDPGNKPFIATGVMGEITPGVCLELEGSYRNDPKYGMQFAVETWREMMPVSVKGIERYLGSGRIRGIGKASAKAIVKCFGKDTIEILDNDIDRLGEVPGLGKKRIAQIKEGWKRHSDMRQALIGLQGYGISSAYAAKIYKEYGADTLENVRSNPYRLAEDISGIGFKIADDIASAMGYSHTDPRRIAAGVLFALAKAAEDGHVFAKYDDLCHLASAMLETGAYEVEEAISCLAADKRVILDNEAVYLPMYYHAEHGAARRLLKLIKAGGTCPKETAPERAPVGMVYDKVQIEAIDRAVKSKVMVLTGGPGTGKTTTVKGIIAALKARKMRILLAAPTGRAAKRMSEATGMEAKTIHRLLEYTPYGGFNRNDDNPLSGDALIIDECSMIDILLFNSLVKAMPEGMRLILVGDTDQLPSVGAGNVLHDIIASGVVPVVRLTHIFRQALESRIVTNAHAINAGHNPDISNGLKSDFFFINTPDEAIPDTIAELVSRRLAKTYNIKASEIQVLTPMHKGEIGAAALNARLQQVLNPHGEYVRRGEVIYRIGDKVMQVKNNYDKNIFNGDIGYISHLSDTDDIIRVKYDGREVEYEHSDLDELMPAYAVTIHKSQGSEFPIVVIPVSMKHFVMLQRNLIYTAITRAKQICVLVGDTRALSYAVGNMQIRSRNTALEKRLRGL